MFECRDTKAAQLPTFRQWCKEANEHLLKPARPVKLIWLPNRYPSFSLETEVFRLRIDDSNPNYESMLTWIESQTNLERVIAIWPTSKERYAYKIDVLPGERAFYEALGDFGLKLTRVEKAKIEKKT